MDHNVFICVWCELYTCKCLSHRFRYCSSFVGVSHFFSGGPRGGDSTWWFWLTNSVETSVFVKVGASPRRTCEGETCFDLHGWSRTCGVVSSVLFSTGAADAYNLVCRCPQLCLLHSLSVIVAARKKDTINLRSSVVQCFFPDDCKIEFLAASSPHRRTDGWRLTESQAILHLSDLSSSRWSWRRHEDAADDFDVWCGDAHAPDNVRSWGWGCGPCSSCGGCGPCSSGGGRGCCRSNGGQFARPPHRLWWRTDASLAEAWGFNLSFPRVADTPIFAHQWRHQCSTCGDLRAPRQSRSITAGILEINISVFRCSRNSENNCFGKKFVRNGIPKFQSPWGHPLAHRIFLFTLADTSCFTPVETSCQLVDPQSAGEPSCVFRKFCSQTVSKATILPDFFSMQILEKGNAAPP